MIRVIKFIRVVRVIRVIRVQGHSPQLRGQSRVRAFGSLKPRILNPENSS